METLKAAIQVPSATSTEAAAEGLSIADSVSPRWAHCSLCGRSRLTKRRMPVWVDFQCGSASALMPERSCASADDIITDWWVAVGSGGAGMQE